MCFIASPRETKIQQSFYHSPNTTYNSASKIHSCQEGFAGLLYVAIRPACLLMSGRVGCVGRAWSRGWCDDIVVALEMAGGEMVQLHC